MDRGGRILRDVLQSLDLPEQMLSGTPLIELTGGGRLFLENHCGIADYTPEQISVRVLNGLVTVKGRHLTIARMSKTQLVITGRICLVELQGRCCK